jgi:hypothetical protein
MEEAQRQIPTDAIFPVFIQPGIAGLQERNKGTDLFNLSPSALPDWSTIIPSTTCRSRRSLVTMV